MLQRGDAIGIVCCSDGHPPQRQETNRQLDQVLREMGLHPVWSPYLYARESVFSGTGAERAGAVNDFYRDPAIRAIFDVSGGNVANGVLEDLDYDLIRQNPKPFFGYSDVTTVLHAIYAKTENRGYLYQLRNLVGQAASLQQRRFRETLLEGGDSLWRASYTFLRGEAIEGMVVGGNLRCLLKLAGTPYWPDLRGKVLFLEAFSGGVGEIAAMAAQLRQIGVFRQIAGLLLGTFTQMEREQLRPTAEALFLQAAGTDCPVAKTGEIGHGADAKGLVIGGEIRLSKQEA